jgi:hypothetical protein
MKIWVAYRVEDPSLLWDIVHDVRLRCTLEVKQALQKFYLDHLPAVINTSEPFQKCLKNHLEHHSPEDAEWLARAEIAHRLIQRCYRINTTSPRRSPYNFDVSVAFRGYKGGIYVIPHCDWTLGKVLDFLSEDLRLTDYHFQTSTDKPDEIPEEAWEERREVWRGMDQEDRTKDVLVLDICKWDIYYQLDPWFDMLHEKFKKTAAEGVDTAGST